MKCFRKICALLLCCSMLFVFGACGKENTSKESKDNMTGQTEKVKGKAHVIILAGQSNAAGMSNMESLKRLTSAREYG